MSEYRCINCKEVKESKSPCNCSVCGYRMFKVPYDRGELLKKEISDCISKHRLQEIPKKSMIFFRKTPVSKNTDDPSDFKIVLKSEDDNRFPSFEKIQEYVASAAKTETFIERMNESVKQLRKHIHEVFEQEYEIRKEPINAEVNSLDSELYSILSELKINIKLPLFVMPEFRLQYRETPDTELLSIADELLNGLIELSEKIRKFIRINNIYGTAYKKRTQTEYKSGKEIITEIDLQNCKEALRKALSKKFIVDIFSDGSDELGEMLKVFWKTMNAIMNAHVLNKKSIYVFSDGITVEDEKINKELIGRISKRYTVLDSIISSGDFLADKTEQELFEIYDKMLELDSFGFMGVNKSGLLRVGKSEKKLNELIGLSGIKESIKKIKAYAVSNKDSEDLNVHMCFMGNPGCGKTEVARIIAGILYENKILPENNVVEVDRSGLVSQYFGATAEKTKRVIESAMGGVLFIDEAYALINNSDGGSDYGKEAIDTLVKAMEDHRGKFCVIFAGYKNETNKMLSANPGLKSRIQFTLDFPDYSRSELNAITELMLKKRNYSVSFDAMQRILDITDIKRKEKNFANAREIRNILDQVIMCQNLRTIGTDNKEIGIVDINKYIRDAKLNLPLSSDHSKKNILSGEEELDQLIGLSGVKRMIKKIRAYAKRNKNTEDFNLHMCFYGNPGTGKTEVARILSRILYDAGVLDEAKLVETDGQGLIGKFVGETAPKTKEKINEAMNGVLFIDEAYSLTNFDDANGSTANYGDEAVAVLLKEMEDHRGQFCVILAGYKSEMKTLLSSNPGFESRIQFVIDFPDYSRAELGEIARLFLKKKNYEIVDDALERLLDITDYFRAQPNFANARTVRNILDKVIMNQNLRTEDTEESYLIIKSDVEEYIDEENIDLNASVSEHKIGF